MKKSNLFSRQKLSKVCFIFSFFAFKSFSYDVVNRFRIIDDKLKTEQMLRPIDHDFIIDINLTLNKNVQNVVKDISDAGKTTGSTTDKLVAAQNILSKYEKTEQTIKANLNIGIPIFSFSAWDLQVQPNLRASADVGANIGIRSDLLTINDILNLFPNETPQELKDYIATLGTGTDIIASCTGASTLPAQVKAYCATQPTGKYIIPDLSLGVPNLSLFAKLDVKAGLFNDYVYGEHFFGNLNLYGLSRTDIYQRVTKDMIASGSKIEFPKEKNTETSLQADYRLGYKNANYKIFLSVEELKINKMKERVVGSKALSYDYAPLLRMHADAKFSYSALSINPFLGIHKRSGYKTADGIYAGADLGAHVWGDRLGLQFRGMLDKQFITLSPRIKLWLMQLEYSMKKPVKSMDEDVLLSALHTIDFRIFF